jgi:hypothetical protein
MKDSKAVTVQNQDRASSGPRGGLGLAPRGEPDQNATDPRTPIGCHFRGRSKRGVRTLKFQGYNYRLAYAHLKIFANSEGCDPCA